MCLSLFISHGHSTQKPASIVCNGKEEDLIYSEGPHKNHLATANTGKAWQRFGKNAGEWTRRVEIRSRKKSLAVGEACMTFWPTPNFKGRNLELWFFTGWDLNFCICSTPLWSSYTDHHINNMHSIHISLITHVDTYRSASEQNTRISQPQKAHVYIQISLKKHAHILSVS